jgi:hypothetical protein
MSGPGTRHGSFVLECLEHVERRGPLRREDRREDPDDDGDREDNQLVDGQGKSVGVDRLLGEQVGDDWMLYLARG